MWVHFHNETKIREYTTSDWDEFITVIENDIGTDRGIEKLTYKPSKLGDEYEVNPDSFDEIIGNPGSHGVFNVYFAVRRMARFPSEREPHEIFAIDFEHFVQQVESISGSTVSRIAYTAQGPNGKEIEFEVGEDTFTELPDLVFNVYFEDDDEKDEPNRLSDPTIILQLPDIKHLCVLRGDLEWVDLVAEIALINPKEQLGGLVAKGEKGKEEEVTPKSFLDVDLEAVILHATYSTPKAVADVEVVYPELGGSGKFKANTYVDLCEQVQQAQGKKLQSLLFDVDSDETQIPEHMFHEMVSKPGVKGVAKFASGKLIEKKRLFVHLPGDKHPSFMQVSSAQDLVTQVDRILLSQEAESTKITMTVKETETEVNSDLFQSLVFPNEPLKVYAREPYIRRVQLPTEKEPRRIFARRLSHLAEEISGLLPPGKELDEIMYEVAGPKGVKIVSAVDEAIFNEAAEDDSMVFTLKLAMSTPVSVQLPEEEEPRSYTTCGYHDLIKSIQKHTALLVQRMTLQVDNDGVEGALVLTEDTFEDQVTPNARISVFFKEVPTLKVLMPDASEPVTMSAQEYSELVTEIRKLSGICEVDKLAYTVIGPKGQQIECDLQESSWDDIADDPANTTIKVYLHPPPKQYKLGFSEGGDVTVGANDFDTLQKQIRTQAGGRRVSKILVTTDDGKVEELTEANCMTPKAAVKVVLEPIAPGTWRTFNVKFPFEKEPRKIGCSDYAGLGAELNKQVPEGFLEMESVSYSPDGHELVLDEEEFNDLRDMNTLLHADFSPDPNFKLPARMISVAGSEQKYPVYARSFEDFMEVIEELADGKPILHLTPILEGARGVAEDDMAKLYYDLPRTTEFLLTVAEGSQAAGAKVKFPHRLEEVLLEAHTFDRLMHLMEQEAKDEGYRVAKVTYFVEGPAGQKIECEDLDEDVFETFEDLDQYTFKVYYEGRPKGSRLVMYPGEDQPSLIIAHSYEEFMEAILEENPDKPTIDVVTYEVPAPKGGTVSFPLDEEAWADLENEENVVYRVIFPEPTTDLLVQFPWDDEPKSVPAGDYAELMLSIDCRMPGDQKMEKITYTVIGPSGQKLEVPLCEDAFGDIEDADTVIKVYTGAAKALYVHYPPVPVAWPADFESAMRGIQTHATPGKKVKGVFLVPPKGGDKIQLTAETFGQLQAIKGVEVQVQYE
jgi:hypothetical protein